MCSFVFVLLHFFLSLLFLSSLLLFFPAIYSMLVRFLFTSFPRLHPVLLFSFGFCFFIPIFSGGCKSPLPLHTITIVTLVVMTVVIVVLLVVAVEVRVVVSIRILIIIIVRVMTEESNEIRGNGMSHHKARRRGSRGSALIPSRKRRATTARARARRMKGNRKIYWCMVAAS